MQLFDTLNKPAPKLIPSPVNAEYSIDIDPSSSNYGWIVRLYKGEWERAQKLTLANVAQLFGKNRYSKYAVNLRDLYVHLKVAGCQ